MRKITCKSLNELAKVTLAISEENQKMYVGGTSRTTGYTGTTGTTGITGGTGYYGGDNTDYDGGNYGGGDTGGSSSSTGYYGTTGTTGSTGYNYGGTGSYTGTAYGDSGYPPYSGEGSTSNPYIPNNGAPSNGVIESGSVYTSDNPCPYEVYSIQMASGTWGGGYVQGVGYVGSKGLGNGTDDVMIDGSRRFTSTFSFEHRDWTPVENVGIKSHFAVKGGVCIENGNITVSAVGTCLIDGAKFFGQIELLVNDNIVESQILQASSGAILIQSGYQDIGSASFNKAKYGYANVKVRLTVSYNNSNYDGTGYWASNPIREIVYSSNNQ